MSREHFADFGIVFPAPRQFLPCRPSAQEVAREVAHGDRFAGGLGNEDAPEADAAIVGAGVHGGELEQAAFAAEEFAVAGEVEAGIGSCEAGLELGLAIDQRDEELVAEFRACG